MSLQQLVHLYQSLNPEAQREVIHFMQFIQQKEETEKAPATKRQAGALPGLITYMAEDFNAPLDDLKPYM